MLLYLLLAFTLVPVVEVMLLRELAERIDWWPTIAVVLLTGVVGAWLARREGFKTISRIQSDLAAGKPPTSAVIDGVLILIAGIVLVTPGVLTDLCGFGLLIPPIRRWVRGWLGKALRKRIVVIRPGTQGSSADDQFIDVPGSGYDVREPSQEDRRIDG